MRKLVTIRTVDSVEPIPHRDFIIVAQVGGWRVIAQKTLPSGKLLAAGDKVLFFEIDTLLDVSHPAFASLAKHGTKEYTTEINGEEITLVGHVLKTKRFGTIYSQGMIVPLSEFNLTGDEDQETIDMIFERLAVKYDVPEIIPVGVKGLFPYEIAQKSGSVRIQNLSNEFWGSLDLSEWIATEKLDGMSITFFRDENGLHTASHNWTIETADIHQKIIDELDLENILVKPGDFVQGELIGPKIQNNRLDLKRHKFYVFSTNLGSDVLADHRVPVRNDVPLQGTRDEIIEAVNGLKSAVNPDRKAEGIVLWHKDGKLFEELDARASIKVISNKYLLK